MVEQAYPAREVQATKSAQDVDIEAQDAPAEAVRDQEMAASEPGPSTEQRASAGEHRDAKSEPALDGGQAADREDAANVDGENDRQMETVSDNG